MRINKVFFIPENDQNFRFYSHLWNMLWRLLLAIWSIPIPKSVQLVRVGKVLPRSKLTLRRGSKLLKMPVHKVIKGKGNTTWTLETLEYGWKKSVGFIDVSFAAFQQVLWPFLVEMWYFCVSILPRQVKSRHNCKDKQAWWVFTLLGLSWVGTKSRLCANFHLQRCNNTDRN